MLGEEIVEQDLKKREREFFFFFADFGEKNTNKKLVCIKLSTY